MNDEKKSLDEQIKEAEIKRIDAETAKLELESKELARIHNIPWYKSRQPLLAIIQAVVAGIVAVPLIWFYVRDIAIPLWDRENIRLAKENIATRDSLETVKKQIEVTKDSLSGAQERIFITSDSLNNLRRELVARQNEFLTRVTEFQKTVATLSQRLNLSETEKTQLEQTVQNLEKERENQQSTISHLNQQIAEAEKLSRQTQRLRKASLENLSNTMVKNMLKKRDFYCAEYSWSKTWSNPQGKGIENSFARHVEHSVIFDATTGLHWQQSGSLEEIYFDDAQKYIANLNARKFAGYNDWRLPTLEEAMSLMEPKKSKYGLHIDPVFNEKQTYIWTANKNTVGLVWVVDFRNGDCLNGSINFSFYVRAVRS